MIYYFEEIPRVNALLFTKFETHISLERKQYASKYKFFSDKVQAVMTFLLLRKALSDELGCWDMPKITKSTYGKPILADMPGIYISLSHCKEGVACAISHSEVGIDIQEYVEYDEQLASIFISNEERRSILKTSNNFTRIWALKESYGKYHGYGVCYDMNKTVVEECSTSCGGISSYSYEFDEFVIAATSVERLPMVRVTLAELIQYCEQLEKLERGAPK